MGNCPSCCQERKKEEELPRGEEHEIVGLLEGEEEEENERRSQERRKSGERNSREGRFELKDVLDAFGDDEGDLSPSVITHPLYFDQPETAVVGAGKWYYFNIKCPSKFFSTEHSVTISVEANASVKLFTQIGKVPTTTHHASSSLSHLSPDDIYRSSLSLPPPLLHLCNTHLSSHPLPLTPSPSSSSYSLSASPSSSFPSHLYVGVQLDVKSAVFSRFGCSFSIRINEEESRCPLNGESLTGKTIFQNFCYHFLEIPKKEGEGWGKVEVKLPGGEVGRLLVFDGKAPVYEEITEENSAVLQKKIKQEIICQSTCASVEGLQEAEFKTLPGHTYHLLLQGWRPTPSPYSLTTSLSSSPSLSPSSPSSSSSSLSLCCGSSKAFLMTKDIDFQSLFVNLSPSSSPSSSSKKLEMLHLFVQSTRPVQLVSFENGEKITSEVEIKPFFPSNQIRPAASMSQVSVSPRTPSPSPLSSSSAPLVGVVKESEGSRYISSLCFLLPSSSSPPSFLAPPSSSSPSVLEGGEGKGWSALVKRKEEGEEIFCSVTASREQASLISGENVKSSIFCGVYKYYVFSAEAAGSFVLKATLYSPQKGGMDFRSLSDVPVVEENCQELTIKIKTYPAGEPLPTDFSQKIDFDQTIHLRGDKLETTKTLHAPVQPNTNTLILLSSPPLPPPTPTTSSSSSSLPPPPLSPSLSFLLSPSLVPTSLPTTSTTLPSLPLSDGALLSGVTPDTKLQLSGNPFFWNYFSLNLVKADVAFCLVVVSKEEDYPWGSILVQKGGLPSEDTTRKYPVHSICFRGDSPTAPPSSTTPSILSFLLLSSKEVRSGGGGEGGVGEWFVGLHSGKGEEEEGKGKEAGGRGGGKGCCLSLSGFVLDAHSNLPIGRDGEGGGEMRLFAVPGNGWGYICIDIFSSLMDSLSLDLSLSSSPFSLLIQIESSLPISSPLLLSKGSPPPISVLFGEEDEEKEKKEKKEGETTSSPSSSPLLSSLASPQLYQIPLSPSPSLSSPSSSQIADNWHRAEIRISPHFVQGFEVDQWYIGIVGAKSPMLLRARALFCSEEVPRGFSDSVVVVEPKGGEGSGMGVKEDLLL